MNAHFRGLMLKFAAFIMIIMGLNTIYMGLSFYTLETFSHHNVAHDIKNEIDNAIVLFMQTLQFVKEWIVVLMNQQ
jgi:hypothetical protein